MDERVSRDILSEIVASLTDAGYDPKAQLTGYIQTGDETYITRRNDARAKAKLLDKEQIRKYIGESLDGS